jgi:hypothetical protein
LFIGRLLFADRLGQGPHPLHQGLAQLLLHVERERYGRGGWGFFEELSLAPELCACAGEGMKGEA